MVVFLYRSLKKDTSLKIRISEQQKNYFKDIASKCDTDLSGLVITATQLYAEHKEEEIETTPQMIDRINNMENAIPKLREKMKCRQRNKKTHKCFGLFKR